VHTVVETPPYLQQAKAAGMSEDVRAGIVTALATDPLQGDLLAGTGGFRKFRFPRPGGGKSGGYRIVTYYHSPGLPVFLVAAFAKNQKDNLTLAERNALAALSRVLSERYKQSKES
jgi:hypothetical protein